LLSPVKKNSSEKLFIVAISFFDLLFCDHLVDLRPSNF
jgi:hypothetical protein